MFGFSTLIFLTSLNTFYVQREQAVLMFLEWVLQSFFQSHVAPWSTEQVLKRILELSHN